MTTIFRTPILKHSEWDSIDIGENATPTPTRNPKTTTTTTKHITFRHVQPFPIIPQAAPPNSTSSNSITNNNNNNNNKDNDDEDDEDDDEEPIRDDISSLFPLPPTYSNFDSAPYAPRRTTISHPSPALGAPPRLLLDPSALHPEQQQFPSSPSCLPPKAAPKSAPPHPSHHFPRYKYSTFPPLSAYPNHDRPDPPHGKPGGSLMMMMMMMTTMRAAGAEEETIDRGDHDCYSDHLDFDDYLDYDDGDTPQQDLHQPAAARQNKSDHYHTPRWGGFSPLAMKSRFVSQLLGSAKFYHHHHHHHYDDDEENRQKEPLLLPLYRRNHHLGLNVKAKNGWKDIGPGLRVMPVDEQQQQQQQDKVYGRSRRRRRRGGGTEVNGGRRQAKFFWVKAFLLSLVLLLVLAFLGHFAWKAVGVTRSSITARLWSSGKTATTCSDDAGPKFCHSVTDINI